MSAEGRGMNTLRRRRRWQGAMSLLVKGRRDGRDIVRVTPQSAGWSYVGFAAYRLAAGGSDQRRDCAGAEAVHRRPERQGDDRGERPELARHRRSRQRVRRSRAVCGLSAAAARPRASSRTPRPRSASAARPAAAGPPARLIEPGSMKRFKRGEGSNTRYVCDILPQTEPRGASAAGRSRHAGRALVELSAAQARHRQPARRKLAGGNLLSPAEAGAGFRVPARLYRRPLDRRSARGRGSRRRAWCRAATIRSSCRTATTRTT